MNPATNERKGRYETMTRITQQAVLAAAVLLAIGAAHASEFCNIKIGARGLAMGGAFTAVSDDANLLQYNPSGLAFLSRKELMISYVRWLGDTDTQYLGYVHPNLYKTINFGVGLQWFDVLMKKTDLNGFEMGDLKVNETMTTISLSSKLNPKTSIGANVKVVNSTLGKYTSNGLLLDAGILLLDVSGLDIGASVNSLQVLPFQYRTEGEAESVTSWMSAGIAKFMRMMVFSADVHVPMGGTESVTFGAGMEYMLMPELGLQVGYNAGTDVLGLSVGARLNLARGEDAYIINISYLPTGISQVFSGSFNIKFK